MAMAEVCSAYPTAGGLYYWSAKLAKANQAGWSWFTGWLNLLGLIGVVASVDYALAVFIGSSSASTRLVFWYSRPRQRERSVIIFS